MRQQTTSLTAGGPLRFSLFSVILGAVIALLAPGRTLAQVQSHPMLQTSTAYEPVRAAIHVHSSYSTGEESLRDIAEQARQRGIKVLIITDDDLLEVSYGLPPWRQLLRVTQSHTSLLADHTMAAYLDEIRRLDASFEDLVIIDGVESAPYYTWDVDWMAQHWTVRGWNKHLLAIGLDDADAYRDLPVLGGDGMWLPQDGYGVLRMLWPVLGMFYALWIGRRMHATATRLLIGGMCLLFLVDGGLSGFRVPRFDPYTDAGIQPYQAWIDAVAAADGLAFWSHPEGASTIPASTIAGIAQVSSETPQHAEDLLRTRGYTGFAALYADHVTATEPGREWDRTLIEYLQGHRSRPTWGTGEIDYHRLEAGGEIHDIQTVLFVNEHSRRGALEALTHGRVYAVRGGDEALQLQRWTVTTAVAEAVSGQRVATAGQPWSVSVVVDKVDGSAEVVDLRLVRGSSAGQVEVVAAIHGVTPLHVEHLETWLAAGAQCYYRLLIRSPTSMLTSNPIFVHGAD